MVDVAIGALHVVNGEEVLAKPGKDRGHYFFPLCPAECTAFGLEQAGRLPIPDFRKRAEEDQQG